MSGRWWRCPPWAKLQLDKLVYDFLWNGKPNLVSREVIVPKRKRGGLALVTIKKKTHALVVQWVKRFTCTPSGWVSLLTFWCFDRFGVPPHVTPSFLVLLIFDLKPYRHSINLSLTLGVFLVVLLLSLA